MSEINNGLQRIKTTDKWPMLVNRIQSKRQTSASDAWDGLATRVVPATSLSTSLLDLLSPLMEKIEKRLYTTGQISDLAKVLLTIRQVREPEQFVNKAELTSELTSKLIQHVTQLRFQTLLLNGAFLSVFSGSVYTCYCHLDIACRI
ncbi:hypothetical protein T265_15317, partial [Opisthorchis viverrini]